MQHFHKSLTDLAELEIVHAKNYADVLRQTIAKVKVDGGDYENFQMSFQKCH